MAKTIITAALTGAVTPAGYHIPETPEQIVQAAYECWQLGAAVVHIHTRAADGKGAMNTQAFREIVEGIRFMYENEYNLLANNTAYAEKEQEGIRFETSEKMEEITTITKDLNQMDKNWKWSTKVEDRLNLPFPESVIEMHWGYLRYLEEPQDYFKVIYDQTEQVFVVKDDQGEDITEELEDTTSLRGTMYSVFWYASSRY